MKRKLILKGCLALALGLTIGLPKATAQIVAVNDGAVIRVEGGLVVSVQGGFLNQNGGIIYNSDTIHIAAEIVNHAPNGMFENGTFAPGAVVMDNTNGTVTPVAEQEISGSQPIYFQTLRLRGTNAKALNGVNAYVRNELELRDREFDLHTNDLRVVTPSVNAITRNGGFITMDAASNGGRLMRYTNSTGNYVFPVGTPTFGNPLRPAYVTPSVGALDSFQVRFGAYDATANVPSYDRAVVNPANICEVNGLYFHTLERHPNSAQTANIGVTVFYDPTVPAENLFSGLGAWLPNATPPPAFWWDVIGQNTSAITEPGLANYTAPSVNINNINDALAFVVPKPPASFDPINTPYCSNAPAQTIHNSMPVGGTFEFFNITAGLPGTLVYSGPDSVVDPAVLGPGTFLLTYFATVNTPGGTCNTELATQTIVINAAPSISGTTPQCAGTQDAPYTNSVGINGSWTIATSIGSTVTGGVNGLVDFGNLTGAPVTDVLTFIDVNGCSATFDVLVNPTPQITGGPNEVCAGTSGVAYTGSTGTGNGLTWSFSPASTIGSTINGTTGVANFGSTVSTVTETILLQDQLTQCSTTLNVQVRPLPAGTFTANDPDNTVCANTAVVLTATQAAGAGFSHSWTVTNAGGTDVTGTTLNNATGTPVTFNPLPNPPSVPAGTYTVNLLVNLTYPSGLACSATSNQTLTVNPMPDFTVDASPSPVCPGQPITFGIVNNDPTQNYAYNWTHTGSASSTAATYVVTATPPSPETVNVTVTNQFACSLDSVKSVVISPQPVVTFAAFPSPLCAGAPSTLTVNVTPGPAANYTYVWTLDGTPIANTLNTADVSNSGVVQVTATNNITGCVGTATTTVTFLQEPTITVTSSVPGNEVCDGDPITFTATVVTGNVSDLTFVWTVTNADGSTSPVVGTPTANGSSVTLLAGTAIDLDVVSATCPNFTFSYLAPITFSILPRPIATFVPQPDSLFYNEVGTFTASFIPPAPIPGVTFSYSYVWDFDRDLNADLIEADSIANWQFPEGTPTGWRPVTLTLVSFPGGCRTTVLDSVYLRPQLGVYVPSAFIPGGPVNSHLEVWAPGIDPSTFKMVIYDRWGIVVAEVDGSILNQRQKGWDGTKNGTPVPEGVYVWTLEAQGWPEPSGRRHKFNLTGTVTVIR